MLSWVWKASCVKMYEWFLLNIMSFVNIFISLFILIQKFRERSSSLSKCSSNQGKGILKGGSRGWRVCILLRWHLHIESVFYCPVAVGYSLLIVSWRWCLAYGRDVVSYCYLRLCNLCRPHWLTSSCVLWNVCSVVYLILSGHFKGSFVCFWPYIISSYILP